MSKRVLVISNGPVPPMKDFKIEGGGMRAWGLAIGLQNHGHAVTVAVRNTYKPAAAQDSGIMLTSWKPGRQLSRLANSFDVVIVSYSTGKTASYLAKHIRDDITFVLDCYVPIYIEISARNSSDVQEEYTNYFRVHPHFNTALKRGDYFLCANQLQKHFYTGVLSALGVINPHSYGQKRVLEVPFGLDSKPLPKSTPNPYLSLGINKDDFVLLWFGGIYPWFDTTPLLQAVKELGSKSKVRLVIVGGKNPYNQAPDFVKRYQEAVAYVGQHKLDNVHFVDWVDFDKRINWYQHANAAISLNNPGEENIYSWRTRVMDLVWGEVPILTNGQDALSEQLLAANAAVEIPELTAQAIARSVAQFIKKPAGPILSNIKRTKRQFYWNNVTALLHEQLASDVTPFSDELRFKQVSRKKQASKRLKNYVTNPTVTAKKAARKVIGR